MNDVDLESLFQQLEPFSESLTYTETRSEPDEDIPRLKTDLIDEHEIEHHIVFRSGTTTHEVYGTNQKEVLRSMLRFVQGL